ncbi:MAG TPA: sugar ABC transporter ATP-binding protein [Solirubrobacteraceae bacterium]
MTSGGIEAQAANVSSAAKSGALIELRNITKRFPGVVALNRVSLTVGHREVVGLVGQNGSGKSTLLNLLAGIHRPDEGEILADGAPVVLRSPRQARARGIGMVFQEQSLIPNLTVAENIALGIEETRDRTYGRYPWKRMRALAEAQLEKVGSSISPRARVASLSQVEKQIVEIAKALTAELFAESDALLLFDEATSTLSQTEIEMLFGVIGRLREHSSVIFVSHRLDEVLEISDRAYVLRDGECVGERTRGSYDENELFRLMVSRESAADYFGVDRQRPYEPDSIRLSVRGLCKAGAYRGISFELHRGEVMGICGVEGSGRDTLMRTIFGIESAEEGDVELDGSQLRGGHPEIALSRGIGYIPAERKEEAALLDMGVDENITISHLDDVKRGPAISRRKQREVARRWVERLGIRTPKLETRMSALSGGNQQKVVFARLLLSPEMKLLLLDHPTRGLDAGAKAEVYDIIRDAAAGGMSILLISDALEETIALSHTILVMKDGAVTGTFPAPPEAKPSQIEIVEKML